MRRSRRRAAAALVTAGALALAWKTGSAAEDQAAPAPEAHAASAAAEPAEPAPEATPEPAPEATAPPPQLTGDPAQGATKAAVCGGCHGPDGNAPVPQFPKLAGQRSDYIAKQLRDFKEGKRVDPIMAGMAAMLSDQDIADVAAHFEAGSVAVGNADPALAAAGERIYRKGRPEIGLLPCIGCHGLYGEGANGAIYGGFPAVSGQNPDYLAKQLQSFRAGARANDWKGIMQIVASRLSDEDIAALIAYVNSLPRPIQ